MMTKLLHGVFAGIISAVLATASGPVHALECNEKLPLCGLFYGNAFAGDAIGNTPFNKAAAFRFRAEYTGTVAEISYANRVSGQSPNDAAKGGGNYSKGDGGRVFAEIQTNGPNDLPSGVSLGRTVTYTPANEGMIVHLKLTPQPKLEAGKIYHIVLHQTNRQSGRVSINNIHTDKPLSPIRGGPYLGNDWAVFTDSGSGWRQREDAELQKIPMIQLTYTDGTTVGSGYNGYGSRSDAKVIGGSRMARQTFTVEGPTRRVDGVWLRLGRQTNNGAKLIVRLERGNGTLMEQVAVSERNVSHAPGSSLSDSVRNNRIEWFYVPFTKTHELATGQQYHLVLQAPSNARYFATTLVPMTVQRWTDRNMWTSAEAEVSTNGGSSWSRWRSGGPSTDLPVLFTLEGGPRGVGVVDGQTIFGRCRGRRLGHRLEPPARRARPSPLADRLRLAALDTASG